MSNTSAIVSALKNGQIIFMHDAKGSYLAASTRQAAALDRILELGGAQGSSEAFVAIAEAPQLYDYVMQIPDLAWDIIEYAEKPLHILYKGGKNVPEAVLTEGQLRIMLVLQPPLRDILMKLRQGVLCVPVAPERVEEFKADIAEALALPPQSGGLTAARIMALGPQGEVKFLKR